MIRQMMNGKVVNTAMVSGSTGDLSALAAILEGQTTIYKSMGTGGTVFNTATPNLFKFSVGKKFIDGSRQSASVVLPHLKTTKHLNDIQTAVVGIWDASILTTAKCEYCNGVGNSSRG
jgi:N-acetyl-beta-hexosaminidase